MAEAPSRKREVGLDLLRILCMFLIVCQHFMNHGGFLKAEVVSPWLHVLHVLFAPTVNVFILVSGYFSIHSRFRPKKLFSLWLQVLFFSVAMSLVSHFVGDGLTAKEWLYAFTPVIHRRYWFFTAYILLYLLSPLLAAGLKQLSVRAYRFLLLGILLAAYLSDRFPITTVLSLNGGYSILWFCALFAVGGYLRLHPVKLPRWCAVLGFALCAGWLLLFRLLPTQEGQLYTLIRATTDYSHPTVLLSAVFLLLAFLGISSDGLAARTVSLVSAWTFGVYLFHEAPTFRRILYTTIFHTTEYHNRPTAALWVLLFAALTFLAGLLAEGGRQALFAVCRKAIERLRRISPPAPPTAQEHPK